MILYSSTQFLFSTARFLTGKEFPHDLVNPGMPKLFVGTDKDIWREPSITDLPYLHKISPEPKQLKIFAGTEHGAMLFDSQYRNEFTALLIDFLKGLSV
jgi:hypothetical protein